MRYNKKDNRTLDRMQKVYPIRGIHSVYMVGNYIESWPTLFPVPNKKYPVLLLLYSGYH